MGGEQRHKASGFSGDLKGGHGLFTCEIRIGQAFLKSFQGRDHLLAAGKSGAAGVRPELPPAGKSRYYYHPQRAEHYFKGDGQQETGSHAPFVAAAVGYKERDDAGQEHHKSVDNTLQQGHTDHIAVGYMGDLMAQHSLQLLPVQGFQQAG